MRREREVRLKGRGLSHGKLGGGTRLRVSVKGCVQRFGSCLSAANLLFLPPAACVPAEEGVGVDVTKRKLPRGQSLSRSAPGEVSRGGVVLMVLYVLVVHELL